MGIGSIVFTIHFLLIDSVTGSALCLISAIRCFLSIKYKRKYFAVIFILIYLFAGFFTFSQISDVFPILGSIIGTIAVFCFSGIKMRQVSMLTNISWLLHNIIYVSIGGIILEFSLIIINIINTKKMRLALQRDNVM